MDSLNRMLAEEIRRRVNIPSTSSDTLFRPLFHVKAFSAWRMLAQIEHSSARQEENGKTSTTSETVFPRLDLHTLTAVKMFCPVASRIALRMLDLVLSPKQDPRNLMVLGLRYRTHLDSTSCLFGDSSCPERLAYAICATLCAMQQFTPHFDGEEFADRKIKRRGCGYISAAEMRRLREIMYPLLEDGLCDVPAIEPIDHKIREYLEWSSFGTAQLVPFLRATQIMITGSSA